MTEILEQAWNKVMELPESNQDLIGYLILEEIQDEQLWNFQFANSQDKLSTIADKVREDIKNETFREKGFGLAHIMIMISLLQIFKF